MHVHGMNWVLTKALILYFMRMNPILMRMKDELSDRPWIMSSYEPDMCFFFFFFFFILFN